MQNPYRPRLTKCSIATVPGLENAVSPLSYKTLCSTVSKAYKTQYSTVSKAYKTLYSTVSKA